jgi:hypothetical protein
MLKFNMFKGFQGLELKKDAAESTNNEADPNKNKEV